MLEIGTAAEACGAQVKYMDSSAPICHGPAIKSLDEVNKFVVPDLTKVHPLTENLTAPRIVFQEINYKAFVLATRNKGLSGWSQCCWGRKSSSSAWPGPTAYGGAATQSLPTPPPHKHRYRYLGVLAPNSPWWALELAQAGRKLGAGIKAPRPKTVRSVAGCGSAGLPARYLWAQLLALVYGVFLLKCRVGSGRVRLLGFITQLSAVRQILDHIGQPGTAPVCAAAHPPRN